MENNGNFKLGYRSLTECVMDYLRNEFKTGGLKPGDEINIANLCKDLKISRTPIREALIQLVKDGFVESVSRKMFRIKKLSLDEIEYIYQVIGILEAEAAGISSVQITGDDIKLLESLYSEMREALRVNDFISYLDMNSESHRIFIKYCRNPVLVDTIEKLKERLYNFPRITTHIHEWEAMMMEDHHGMIQHLKNHNRSSLENLIKNVHWNFERNLPYIRIYYDLANGDDFAEE